MPDKLNSRQLVWRCRRGIRELDVIFDRFLQTQYPGLKLDQQSAFERLLEVQDPLIMDWLTGRTQPDDLPIAEIIARLRVMSVITPG